jgi:hypothetical protein
MILAASLGSGTPMALLTKGAVRLARGIDLDDVEVVAFDGELHVHQAADVEGFGELLRGVADAVLHRWREAEGRDDAGAVAGVDAGLFDVLHDGADDGRFAVADAIDIDLGGVFEEAVHEHGAVGRGLDGVLHVVGEFGVAIDDLHGAATEHEAGVADLRGDGQGLLQRGGGAAGGLVQTEIVEQLGEHLAVFGELDVLRRGADDADAVFFEAIDGKNIPLGVGVAHGVKSVPPHARDALRTRKPQSPWRQLLGQALPETAP